MSESAEKMTSKNQKDFVQERHRDIWDFDIRDILLS